MKPVRWRNSNHMQIDTGHKTFDQQCESLGTGNVYGTCQKSSYIRAYDETKCNGFTSPPGQLRSFDLKQFKDIPFWVCKEVEELTKSEGGILYEIRHWGKRVNHSDYKRKFIHGYILTHRGDYANSYGHIRTWMIRHDRKSYRIMEVVREYIVA